MPAGPSPPIRKRRRFLQPQQIEQSHSTAPPSRHVDAQRPRFTRPFTDVSAVRLLVSKRLAHFAVLVSTLLKATATAPPIFPTTGPWSEGPPDSSSSNRISTLRRSPQEPLTARQKARNWPQNLESFNHRQQITAPTFYTSQYQHLATRRPINVDSFIFLVTIGCIPGQVTAVACG